MPVAVWRGLRWTSLEYLTLNKSRSRRVLDGTIIGLIRKTPFSLHYRIICDRNWETRRADISTVHGTARKQLRLVVDQDKRWRHKGRELASVRGSRDIDLSISPSTNTLPIKRLNLRVGESGETTAAWVQFPALSIRPLHQTYMNLGHHTFAYSSRSFKTRIKLDRAGLVMDYPPFWKRISA